MSAVIVLILIFLLFKIISPFFLGMYFLSRKRMIDISYIAALLNQFLNRPRYYQNNSHNNSYDKTRNSNNQKMSRREACEILGVMENASPAEIKKAYLNLMKKIHPDAGGSAYLAQKVNQAKEQLLS